MDKPALTNESVLPLEILGYEVNSAIDVFVLTQALDAELARALEIYGYMQRSSIELSDGQIVDGWVKV